VKSEAGYPIDDLLDFLEPDFPSRVNLRKGFGRSLAVYDYAQDVQRVMQAFLDEWIDSGFMADGSEEPARRNFTPMISRPIPQAVAAMAVFLDGLVVMESSKTGESVYRIIPDTLGDGSANRSWCQRLGVKLVPNGGLEFFPVSDEKSVPLLTAAGMFLEFYRSEWLFSLMRCNCCRRFFAPESVRLRYVRGWHCADCGTKVSATVATKNARDKKHVRVLDLAAKAYLQLQLEPGSPWPQDKVPWITAQVNARLGRAEKMAWGEIKRNTIQRSREEIEARAAELKQEER
jgi:hypothetical protein